MRLRVSLQVPKERATDINRRWRADVGACSSSYLIRDDETVGADIAASNVERERAQRIYTPDDWDAHFPPLARGLGEIALDVDENTGAFDPSDLQTFRASLAWVLAHRDVFESVSNLDVVAGCPELADIVSSTMRADAIPPLPSFQTLPRRPGHRVYDFCLEHDAATLWAAFLAFQAEQTKATWERLKDLVVPWSENGETVYKLALKVDEARTQRPALRGTFSTGALPSVFDIERALRQLQQRPGSRRDRSRRIRFPSP